MVKEIVLLGDKRLYQKSESVQMGKDLDPIIADLHDTLMDFRIR